MADDYVKRLSAGQTLCFEEAKDLMLGIGRGEYLPTQVASILTSLRLRGETVDEIAGSAAAFRELAVAVPHDIRSVVFDCCGTGGDGSGTFNISTAAAIVFASMGVATAKHGNRAVSSNSGSADVLEALGVKISLSPDAAARCLKETSFCFLYAPNYHPAMKHVAPVRRELGIPTLFNILGPLLNPAGCTHQIIGTPDEARARKIAEVARRIGLQNVTTFYNKQGVDELLEGAECYLHRTSQRGIETSLLHVGNGSKPDLVALAGGSAAQNAEIIDSILRGEKSVRRRTVVLNAAAGLWVAERFGSIDEAMAACDEAIDSGRALKTLKSVIDLTQRLGS
jgi:anthranilate phosphoribosyltransferase